MNERIRELARQAYIEARLDENPKWRESFVSEAAMNEIQSTMVKFAELIVNECITACATDRLGKTVSAEELIRQHFGVEE